MSTADIELLGVDIPNVGTPSRNKGLYNVPILLSDTPDRRWAQLFVRNWNNPSRFTNMHRPGIARVVGARIHLDGTTIEEVAEYHKDTLELAVEETNEQRRLELAATAYDQIHQNLVETNHRRHVQSVASTIDWRKPKHD